MENHPLQVHRAGDLWGGLAAMLVALPSAIAFGVTIFAPLGAGYAAQGALAGILGATTLGLVASSLGGTDRLITAPCAPAAAVLSAIAVNFVQQGINPESCILMLMLIALLAGVIQIALGLAGIGRLIRFIPYPVVSGYLSGVGLTIIGSQLPRVLGAPKSMGLLAALQHPEHWRWQSIVVGLLVVSSMLLVPRVIRAVPAAIIAMLIGILGYLSLGLIDPSLWNSHANPLVVGPLVSAGSDLLLAMSSNIHALRTGDLTLLSQVLLPALTLAALLSIDTLKTCVVLDALTSSHHNPNRELVAQGLGNLSSALIGGIPGAGQMGASMVNLSSGAQTRRSGMIEGGFSLLAFVLLAPLVAWVPIAALGGILLVIGFRMIDLRSLEFFRSKATRFDFFVILAVIITALSVSLIAASGVGILLAIALYLREQMRSSVLRRKIEGGGAFSKVVRHEQELAILLENGHKTIIVELQGSLFFGTAHQLFLALEPEIGPRTYVILNMRRVQSLDLTATHVLEQIKDRLESVGAYLIFTEIPHGLPSGLKMKRYLRQVGLVRDSEKALAFRQMDEALEWIEGQVLESADYSAGEHEPPVTLEQLEKLLCWKPGSLSCFAAIIEQRHAAAGEKVFEMGTPGGDLIFIRSGTIRVSLPIRKKEAWHIGTFGRGDFIGEMGFLDSVRRSAEAVAMSDTEYYVLTRNNLDQALEHSGVSGALLFEGIASVLAMRVRMMNKELRALRE
jgi:SulP family sulfate permease